MVRNFDKYLFVLCVLTVIALVFFCGHYTGVLIDFGREVYYPEQILNGQLLYKDLFNIYGPLAYQINAVLYKLFGIKLSTLYFAGCVCSVLVVSGIYLIAKRFLSKFLSFCIGIFTISVGVCVTSIFNFHFPYSWAVLYGLVSFLYSLYFLLKFNNGKKESYLIISSLLAGISMTCKYDFLLYGLMVLFFIIKYKSYKSFGSFLLVPVISFGVLFLQGLGIFDVLNTFSIVKTMAQTNSLAYFYQNSGVYFHPKSIPMSLVLFLQCAIPLCGIFLGAYLFEKRKVVSIIISIFSYIVFLLLFVDNYKIAFGFLPIFLIIFAALSYRKFNSNLLILIIASICVGVKVFWVLLLQSYGNYFISIILISVVALLFKYLPKKLEKTAGIYLLLASLIILMFNIPFLEKTKNKITTSKGTIYTSKNLAQSSNDLIKFLEKDTSKNDVILILPEGLMINFLSQRKSDGFYNSLLPLYVETFSQEKLIEYYQKEKPQYIIFNNLNMKDYYFNYICEDYALNFCRFVLQNYNQEKIIGDKFRYLIFKKI